MSEQLPERPVSKVDSDLTLRRIREWVSAGIAVAIILGTIVMMLQAFAHLNNSDEFDRVKDLLLFLNPLLGVVIGYYFNKTTTEARAETAESTAKDAMASAQQAADARNKAEAEAKGAKSDAEEAKSALKEVGQAAEKMMAQAPAAVGVLSVDEETGEPVEDPRIEFQMAWKRARRLVE